MKTISKNIFSGIFALLIIGIFFVWYVVFYFEARAGKTAVHFFDVGQGDGALIETPDDKQILIDGGPDKRILSKLGNVLLPWDRHIDLLILTHPHADHLDGLLEVLKRYDVGAVVESSVLHSLPEYSEWHRLIQNKNIPLYHPRAGQRIQLAEKLFFDVLTPEKNFENTAPKNIHDAMIVGRLSYGADSILFMGDAEKKIEYSILAKTPGIRSTVLKVGHHGSKTSTSELFLQAASAQFAVISVGGKNRYGHPHQEVISRLQEHGVKIFRTDEIGDILLVSNGSFLKIIRAR